MMMAYWCGHCRAITQRDRKSNFEAPRCPTCGNAVDERPVPDDNDDRIFAGKSCSKCLLRVALDVPRCPACGEPFTMIGPLAVPVRVESSTGGTATQPALQRPAGIPPQERLLYAFFYCPQCRRAMPHAQAGASAAFKPECPVCHHDVQTRTIDAHQQMSLDAPARCPVCWELFPLSDERCRGCGSHRDGSLRSEPRATGAREPWFCMRCGAHQPAVAESCLKCGAPESRHRPDMTGKTCAKCQTHCALEAFYCQGCGEGFHDASIERQRHATWYCVQCGGRMKDATPCTRCGSVRPYHDPFKSQILCVSCHSACVVGSHFCDNCGAKLTPPKPNVTPDPAVAYCVGCGLKIAAGGDHCENCPRPHVPDGITCVSCAHCWTSNLGFAAFCKACGRPMTD